MNASHQQGKASKRLQKLLNKRQIVKLEFELARNQEFPVRRLVAAQAQQVEQRIAQLQQSTVEAV
jgi:hypothetical protein